MRNTYRLFSYLLPAMFLMASCSPSLQLSSQWSDKTLEPGLQAGWSEPTHWSRDHALGVSLQHDAQNLYVGIRFKDPLLQTQAERAGMELIFENPAAWDGQRILIFPIGDQSVSGLPPLPGRQIEQVSDRMILLGFQGHVRGRHPLHTPGGISVSMQSGKDSLNVINYHAVIPLSSLLENPSQLLEKDRETLLTLRLRAVDIRTGMRQPPPARQDERARPTDPYGPQGRYPGMVPQPGMHTPRDTPSPGPAPGRDLRRMSKERELQIRFSL